jgi:hypothetical protein
MFGHIAADFIDLAVSPTGVDLAPNGPAASSTRPDLAPNHPVSNILPNLHLFLHNFEFHFL